MQLSSTLSFFTLAALASAAPVFNLLVIRSGSSYQYASITVNGNVLHVGGDGDEVTFELNDDSTLVDTKTNLNIKIDDSAFTETAHKIDGSKGFSIKDGYLSYGSNGIYACPNGKGDVELTTSCSDSSGSPIALKITNEHDSNGAQTSASATSTKATTSAAPSTLTTKTATTKAATTTTAVPHPAPTANTKFGIVAIHSGTQFQNAAIKKVPDHPHVFSVGGNDGSDLTLTLKPDGTLVDQDGRGIYVDSKTGEFGDVDPWGQEKPSSGFAIKDGYLTFQGKNNWKACPSGDNKFSLANNDCTGGTGIALSVVNQS